MFIYLMLSVQHSPVHRYKPVTLYKLYRTWHRVISVYTAPVTEHNVRASDWSAGPIQSSDWPTPWTDTRVGPNNCSLHNNVQSTQHLHLALFWSQHQQRHGEWIMQTGVRTLWSVTWQCDIVWRGGLGAGLTQGLGFLRLSQNISSKSVVGHSVWW